MITKNAEGRNYWLLGGVCFFAYTACYAGRGILSAMIPQILQQTSFTKDSLGLMGSAFFFSYGIGQLINGFMGDFVKAKYMVTLGLLLAGSIICAFPAFESRIGLTILWGLCGLCCSMLWGPLSKVIAENTTEKAGRVFMTLLTVASLLGTMATYLIAVIISSRNSWELAFYLTGVFLLLTAIFWYFFLGILEGRGSIKYIAQQAGEHTGISKVITKGFLLMTMVSLLNGIIRNAVVFWIPTYITEQLQVSTTMAASISTALPVINLMGTFAGLWLLKKMNDNEKKVLVFLFGLASVMFTLMYLLDGSLFSLTLISLFLASAAMTGACNMIFSVYCLRFANTGRVSAITGFLNFTSYASASVASTMFTGIVQAKGWNTTVALWAAIAAVGVVFAYLATRVDVAGKTSPVNF